MLAAERRAHGAGCFGAGLLLGLATFANYLAVFASGGALLWLLLRRWRQPALWTAAGIGFALMLPADLFFFLAQKGSRVDQFPPFRLLPGLARLAQYAAANVFGGLPLYVGGTARVVLGGVLAALLVGLVGLIAARFRRLGMPGTRWLPVLAALAVPTGLVLLGIAFDNTPIELRYLSFATPFLALLSAGALASLPRSGPLLLATLLAIQATSLAGMMTRPETMQPQQQTALEAAALAGPDGIVVLPHGNDGVGVVAAFLNESPDWLHVLVVPRGESAEQLRARVQGSRVVLALLGLDGDSRATLPVMEDAFAGDRCWREDGTTAHVAVYDRAC
jgi:hypothetical protein